MVQTLLTRSKQYIQVGYIVKFIIFAESKKWGALKQRAEIIPLNLIRIMPAEGKKSIILISIL